MDTARDVLIRITTELVTGKMLPPDMAPLISAQEKVKESTEQATYALQNEGYALQQDQTQVITLSELEATAAAAKKQYAEQTAAAAEHERLARQRANEAALHAMRPLNMLIGGTLHMAHAVALLSATNEEDAAQMVRKLMQYEGYFMLVRGGIHTVHGLVHAYQNLAVAAGLAATAQEVALAPLAGIAAAVVAVGAAVYFIGDAYDLWGNKAEAATKKAREAEEVAKILHKNLKKETLEVGDENNKLADSRLENQVKSQGLGIEEKHVQTVQMRAAAEKEAFQIQKFGLDQQVQAEQRLTDLRVRERDELVEIGNQLRENLRAQQEAEKAAARELAIAEKRVESANVLIGKLNSAERAELQRLNEKAGHGQLSNHELERLERLGGENVREYVENQRRLRGERLGGDMAFFSNVGAKRRRNQLEEAESQFENTQEVGNNREGLTANELARKIQAKERELVEAGKAADEALVRLHNTIITKLNKQREEINALEIRERERAH